MTPSRRSLNWRGLLGKAAILAFGLGFLYLVWGLYLLGEPLFAVISFAVGALGFAFFWSPRFYKLRFVYPAIAAVFLFILLPVLYTSAIGFTNFGSRNLLTLERVQAYHLSQIETDASTKRPFGLVAEGDAFRIFLPEDAGRPALLTDAIFGTDATAQIFTGAAPETLPIKAIIQNKARLAALTIHTPNGPLTQSGLRAFAASKPAFTLGENDTLTASDGTILSPNPELGLYQTPEGETVAPGWRVGVGFDNFKKVMFSEGIRGPIFKVFVWTTVFAFLSMVFTFAVGTGLAVILEWKHLRFAGLYRVLLILPYAVPAFISILVFRGLFNQNFGEINLILSTLFGIAPDWFTNPNLARGMLLLVNTWLGYPYMMLLAAGFLQAVPRDLYKASALEGASGMQNFFSITLPQILPPFVPLLISNFAFNFNNVVLILLLTRGGPDMPGTLVTVGSTDILGSFTFRLAFQNSGQDFGMAGAISTLIFIVTGAIAYYNFKAMQKYAAKKGAGHG
ncbi:MAG: maltose ABC transporter permease MalF [Rhodobacteraceae bacterium]|nr:maltose ABC transporter permease MalF [Paracoccaceae bacterium]